MRHADEKNQRATGTKKSGSSAKRKWGEYTHYSPDKEAKAAIKKVAAGVQTALFLWLDERLQGGYTLSLKWIDDREAVRVELRAPGEDRMACPALAAYHVDTTVALCALWHADTSAKTSWEEVRMTPQEAHNW